MGNCSMKTFNCNRKPHQYITILKRISLYLFKLPLLLLEIEEIITL